MENNSPVVRPGYGPRAGSGSASSGLSTSRAAVLALLQGQPGAVRLETLVRASGLHPNTVREHLDGLLRRGLVTREQAPAHGRGRPAWLYTACGRDVASAPEYAGLASALAATIVRTSADPAAEAERAGHDWGRQLAAQRAVRPCTDDAEARRAVVDLLADLGFDPTSDAQCHVVHLHTCPLLDAAQQHPEVVCAVHLGLAKGALHEYGSDPGRTTLEPFSEPGACTLSMEA